MDHSLGTLLAQNNDQGYEQAIYYLSRTMIRVKHRYNPVKKRVSSFGFRHLEDATLSCGPYYSCHLKMFIH